MLGERLFVDVRLDAGPRPSLRVFGTRVVTGHVSAGGGVERFGLTTGGLEACPLRWPATTPLGVRPCVALEAGEIDGVGVDVANPRRATTWWLEAALRVRVEWSPVRAFVLGAEGGAGLPYTRPTFQLAPAVYVYRVPEVVGGVTLDAGFRFL
jgi:hypothetical protein